MTSLRAHSTLKRLKRLYCVAKSFSTCKNSSLKIQFKLNNGIQMSLKEIQRLWKMFSSTISVILSIFTILSFFRFLQYCHSFDFYNTVILPIVTILSLFWFYNSIILSIFTILSFFRFLQYCHFFDFYNTVILSIFTILSFFWFLQ